MTPELKEKWVTALTSDDYAQTKGFLKTDECTSVEMVAYCCLGVLMEISGCPITDGQIIPTHEQLSVFGLTPYEACYLSELNDNGATFKEIAVIIHREV